MGPLESPAIRKRIGLFLSGLRLGWVTAFRFWFRYRRDRRSWIKKGGKIDRRYQILVDYSDKAGVVTGHYFHQDLLVAGFVRESNPVRHVDVGSRIDGFVAHVASFRPIEILDIRDLDEVNHPNISFVQADLMQISSGRGISTDSISCLHAIEHFGLGRYGDPIDPEGHLKGFRNIVNMLDPGGMLYVSFPIGRKSEVHFNAHRVFHPHDIFSWPIDDAELSLERFDYVDDQGALHRTHPVEVNIPDVQYGCGIYSFRKLGKTTSQTGKS